MASMRKQTSRFKEHQEKLNNINSLEARFMEMVSSKGDHLFLTWMT